MQKRSHALLASALLRCEGGFPARRYEIAFLIGSVQPDCNPLSYLKGSARYKKFGGHTYHNARRYIQSRVRRLHNRSRWNLWSYYTLGKLTHYIADAFTWPHNDHFPGSPLEHHTYETALRARFAEFARENTLCHSECPADFPERLEILHERYQSAPGGMDRDIRYILAANELLMAYCRSRAWKSVPASIPANNQPPAPAGQLI